MKMVMMNMRFVMALLLVLSGCQPRFCSSSSPKCSFSSSISIWMSVIKKTCVTTSSICKIQKLTGTIWGENLVQSPPTLGLLDSAWPAAGS